MKLTGAAAHELVVANAAVTVFDRPSAVSPVNVTDVPGWVIDCVVAPLNPTTRNPDGNSGAIAFPRGPWDTSTPLLLPGFRTSNDGRLTLVEGSTDDVRVNLTLTNTGEKPVHLLKWQLPGSEDAPLFQVERDGQPVDYEGALIKRAAPSDKDYQLLKAGQSLTVQAEVSGLYDMSAQGQYSIRYLLPTVAQEGKAAKAKQAQASESNAVTLWVGGVSDDRVLAKAARALQARRDRFGLIGRGDVQRLADRPRRAGRGLATLGENGDPAAERLGVTQHMRTEEDGAPPVAQPQDQGTDIPAAERVEQMSFMAVGALIFIPAAQSYP